MKKITVSQTRQIQSYEPRKIEIEIEIDDNEDWKKITKETIAEINDLLYPETEEEIIKAIPF